MVSSKENAACNIQPERLESIRRWRDELEGSNRIYAFELMNLAMEGKITNEEAFALLGRKRG
jgi:hypothetical protein